MLNNIAKKQHSRKQDFLDPVDIATITKLYNAVLADGKSPLHASVCENLSRLLEMSILRDTTIFTLMERWNALIGRAPEIIRERLEGLTGQAVPPELVNHFIGIIGGTAVRRGRRAGNYEVFLPSLFEDISRTHPKKELRCACCGYHFLERDMGEERRNLAISYGLKFATRRIPERTRDYYKPVSIARPNESRSFLTTLTVEHIIPEEGLGPSSFENLEILCKFCNNGKQATRWALEPLSSFAAGGASDYPLNRDLNLLMQTTIVSALRFADGKCENCKTSNRDSELTVRPIQAKSLRQEAAKSFSPWLLRCSCYSCV